MSAALCMRDRFMSGIQKGYEVTFIKDYDVWGHNVNGMAGLVIKEKTSFNKCVVYIPTIEKWCEPELDMIEMSNEHVTPENREFLSRVKEMEYTLPTHRNFD